MSFTCSRCGSTVEKTPHKLLKFCDPCKVIAKKERRTARKSQKKAKVSVSETASV